jgi:hypothetical protein
MNDRQLKKLFGAVRQETPPAPPEGFDFSVLQAIRHSGQSPQAAGNGSLFDQLNHLFPRLAWIAAAIIAISIVGDLVSSAANPSLTDSISELSDQWLLTPGTF